MPSFRKALHAGFVVLATFTGTQAKAIDLPPKTVQPHWVQLNGVYKFDGIREVTIETPGARQSSEQTPACPMLKAIIRDTSDGFLIPATLPDLENMYGEEKNTRAKNGGNPPTFDVAVDRGQHLLRVEGEIFPLKSDYLMVATGKNLGVFEMAIGELKKALAATPTRNPQSIIHRCQDLTS